MKILINRNDNLGDIVYTLQLAGLLKKHFPHCSVCFVIRDYASALFEYASDVDSTLSWDSLSVMSAAERKNALKNFDVFINVRAHAKMAFYAWEAGINIRIGNARRWYHWLFCNKRVPIKRKNSSRHEVEFNAQLLAPLIGKQPLSAQALFNFIHLDKRVALNKTFDLPNNKHLIICHPASNGNGREWPIENFIALIKQHDPEKYHFILTGSKSEKSITDLIEKACPQVSNLAGSLSLFDFIALITKVDTLIASGTGPLHIAAALGTKTIGLFPPIPALDSARWGPLFEHANNLELKLKCEKSCENTTCDCMKKLKIKLTHYL